MNYNVLIEAFCESYYLGQVTDSRLLPTGLGNRTYFVETTTGKYVIKALNPSKVKTDDDIKRLELTEHISELANQNGIASIPAKKINGKIINTLHGQHYIVFDFFEGKIIPLNEITTENCFEVGLLLAELHNTNFEDLLDSDANNNHIQKHNYGNQLKSKVDWKYYLEQAADSSPGWLNRLEDQIIDIDEIFDLSFLAYLSFVPQDVVIAHGDMFSHNVLWKDGTPYIIDWEQSGFIDATYDCLYTAIRWATKNHETSDKRSIDKKRLYAFLDGYIERRNLNVKNFDISLYMILYKRLGYLRSAFIKYLDFEDEISKKRAEGQITFTLSMIKSYKNLINQLEDIRQYVAKRQPEQKYEKSPSYEIIPKMEQFVKNYNDNVDKLKKVTQDHKKLTKDYKQQINKINQLTKELKEIEKKFISRRVFRKIKRILKKIFKN